jgi:two-component system, cell cycle response regulator DivK
MSGFDTPLAQEQGAAIWDAVSGVGEALQRADETGSCALAGNGRRILVVDDAEDIVSLMKAELELLGYVVMTASDGRAGVEVAKGSPPDLIVSDIKMPIVDGYEMIRAIRATPGLSAIPAIALTGFGAKATSVRALAAGFDACLSKPAEREDMLAVISRLAGEGRLLPAPSTRPPSNSDQEKQNDES